MLTDAQCTLISPTPFVYQTHPGLIIIPDGTIYHANSNTQIAHTEKVRLFREVKGVEQALVIFFATVKEAHLADIRNRTKNSINDTVVDVLTHLQDNYSKLMTHKLLEREEIFNKTT